MSILQSIIFTIAAISLFVHGLSGFSKEIQELGAEKLKSWLGNFTQNRFKGLFLGAFFTAIIQSSSAVTAITVSLVDTGIITFQNSLAIMLGANIGTTVTAWVVTLKLTELGPFFIVLGTLISILPYRIHLIGKSLFYFGLIFFSLDLIGDSLSVFKENQLVVNSITNASGVLTSIIIGIIVTALVQSSSVTTGLAIMMIQQGLMPPEMAIAIVIGANVGTTSTALLASITMTKTAKMTAIANFLFNFCGSLLFIPFIGLLHNLVSAMSDNLSIQVAYAHLIFNVVTSLIFISVLDYVKLFVEKYFANSKVK